MEKLKKLAEMALKASAKETASFDDNHRGCRYAKAASTKAFKRFLRACDEAGLTTKEAVDFINKLKE